MVLPLVESGVRTAAGTAREFALTLTLPLLIILKNGKMLKIHTKQQQKNRLKNKTVFTIICDGKLRSCKI
jgi:hypothetical protein